MSLRERRRRETRHEIADAALDLFESKGLHDTTTDDIATAAGVSPRTFFRYAETKEHAMFIDDDDFEILSARVARGIDEGLHPIDALESAQRLLLADFDADDPADRAKLLRRRRIVISEPNLLALALARDAENTQRLLDMLMAAEPAASELKSRARVTALSTTMRLTFDEWVRRAEDGEDGDILPLYAEIRQSLAAHFATDRYA